MIMPHPSKKQRLLTVMETDLAEVTMADQIIVVTSGDLSIDVLANVFAFLVVEDIMQKRCVCKKWSDAATKTIVPLTDFLVDSLKKYDGMVAMTRALPNLQQITLGPLENRHQYSVGEDPNEGLAAITAHYTIHDIGIISNFSKLRILEIDADLNGSYPFLFNSFPLLQKLRIDSDYLKWDPDMLAGLPLLKVLGCYDNRCFTGNISSLRVLKGTLEHVTIFRCPNVEGNFMDLADFPHLKVLNLYGTAVTGDIRDIGDNDFSAVECLALPKGVYGGKGYEFQRISDAPDVIRALYLLRKQRPALALSETWHGILSEDSPDWYGTAEEEDDDSPPFYIRLVQAGSRIGYRWQTRYYGGYRCEANWLDPEPDSESSDYGKYIEELEQINSEVGLFRGFYQPPTEEEYNRLWEEHTMDD